MDKIDKNQLTITQEWQSLKYFVTEAARLIVETHATRHIIEKNYPGLYIFGTYIYWLESYEIYFLLMTYVRLWFQVKYLGEAKERATAEQRRELESAIEDKLEPFGKKLWGAMHTVRGKLDGLGVDHVLVERVERALISLRYPNPPPDPVL